MGLLTVKLNDIEHDRLRRMAEERSVSMAEMIKGWIREDRGARDKAHLACDAEIADLKAALGRQVSTRQVDVSTSAGLQDITGTHTGFVSRQTGDVLFTNIEGVESPVLREVAERINATPQMVEPYPKPNTGVVARPGFLAAKVDDCVSCGHEWHSNEDAGCRAAKGGRDRCGCKAYLDAGTPF